MERLSNDARFDSLWRVQLDMFRDGRPGVFVPDKWVIGQTEAPVWFVRNPRARRYFLRVRRDGSIRVTIPRGGSLSFAVQFARKHADWIAQELRRNQHEQQTRTWTEGTEILFRGVPVRIETHLNGGLKLVQFGDQVLPLQPQTMDLRPSIEQHLWLLAGKELSARTLELAAKHGLRVHRVAVRSQRSRWGSCSPRRTISLNWRLIQAPPWVRDYLIVHELMHLREMNHSELFWRWVASACPEFEAAEAWLDGHAHLLR
jgi:predicted metal-dependent hydrolase